MGFKDIFKEKTCSFCGKKIGLLGWHTLADGYICKDCLKDISPWFNDYKNASVDDLHQQKILRKQNLSRLNDFEITNFYGDQGVIIIDANQQQFVVMKNVSDSYFNSLNSLKKLMIDRNTDIIDFSQVGDISLMVDESRCELFEKHGDEKIPYNPPLYEYTVNFKVDIEIVDHPYIDHMYFNLNRDSLKIQNVGYRERFDPRERLSDYLGNDYARQSKSFEEHLINQLLNQFRRHHIHVYGFHMDHYNEREIFYYDRYIRMFDEIEYLMQNK